MCLAQGHNAVLLMSHRHRSLFLAGILLLEILEDFSKDFFY